MAAIQKTDKRVFVIVMGFFAAGLQIMSTRIISPFLEECFPGFTDTAAHHMLITALTLAVPAAICLYRTGSFSGRFAGLKNAIIWGGVFALAIIAFNIFLMQTASLIAVGSLHMPGIAAPQTGVAVFMAVAILGPLAEEALYRGYILDTLLDKNSMLAAILVTSLLAVMMHAVKYPRVEITYFMVKFAQSLIICLAYVKGRLGASMGVHIINNAAAFILY